MGRNPILLGTAERIPPDVRCGDVCEIRDVPGLWVPFAGAGGRSDGSTTRFAGWRFLAYPDGDRARTFALDHVARIAHPVDSAESVAFWPKVEEYTS